MIPTLPDSLELSPEQFRNLVEMALDQLVPHLAGVADLPLDGTAADPDATTIMAASLRQALPASGTDPRALLADLVGRVVPHSFTTISPGFMAYVPGGGLLHAAVADLVADTLNRYVTVWRAAPGLAEIERTVGRWLCDIIGFPASALGVLTTGGSLGGLSALITARRARFGDAEFRHAVIYTSDQVHHAVTKAAVQIGFAPLQLRSIPTDDAYRMRLDALAAAVAADRAAGRVPFLVVASAGTVHTGAVDDLRGVADLARREQLWLHVDAAYGGFFCLTARGREAMAGIEAADSVVLDPHKGLFLPYGTGALLVRDAAALQRAFGGWASYLPRPDAGWDGLDLCDVSPELSRDFRALRLWLPLKLHGIDAFRAQLDEKLDLARWAADALRAVPGIDLVAEPQLSLLAFRLVRPGRTEAELDALNRALLDRINARQRVLLSGTTLGERFVIRMCILSFRTHRERVDEAVTIVREVVRELASG